MAGCTAQSALGAAATREKLRREIFCWKLILRAEGCASQLRKPYGPRFLTGQRRSLLMSSCADFHRGTGGQRPDSMKTLGLAGVVWSSLVGGGRACGASRYFVSCSPPDDVVCQRVAGCAAKGTFYSGSGPAGASCPRDWTCSRQTCCAGDGPRVRASCSLLRGQRSFCLRFSLNLN